MLVDCMKVFVDIGYYCYCYCWLGCRMKLVDLSAFATVILLLAYVLYIYPIILCHITQLYSIIILLLAIKHTNLSICKLQYNLVVIHIIIHTTAYP
jgi:hypothetical protein